MTRSRSSTLSAVLGSSGLLDGGSLSASLGLGRGISDLALPTLPTSPASRPTSLQTSVPASVTGSAPMAPPAGPPAADLRDLRHSRNSSANDLAGIPMRRTTRSMSGSLSTSVSGLEKLIASFIDENDGGGEEPS